MLTQNDNRNGFRILTASNSKTTTTMRQIEKQMLAAIRNGRNFNGNNTTVNHSNGNSYVYLFGNLIYKVIKGKAYFSLAGWNTNTTRSRLNALGVNVKQKDFTPYYNGSPINLSGFYPVND